MSATARNLGRGTSEPWVCSQVSTTQPGLGANHSQQPSQWQEPIPYLPFWRSKRCPSFPTPTCNALRPQSQRPDWDEEDEGHSSENTDCRFTTLHCATPALTAAMRGRAASKIGKHGEGTKKKKKSSKQRFSAITLIIQLYLLLFSINTVTKKLNQYKRWSNDIDKQGAGFLSSF